MFCINCGSRVGDNDKFCMHCGTRIEEIGTDNNDIEKVNESNDVIVDSDYRDYTVENDNIVNVIDDYADSDSNKDSDNDFDSVVDNNEVYNVDISDYSMDDVSDVDEVSYVIDENQYDSTNDASSEMANEVEDNYSDSNDTDDSSDTTESTDTSLEENNYEYEEDKSSVLTFDNSSEEVSSDYREPVFSHDDYEDVDSNNQYDSPELEEVTVQEDDSKVEESEEESIEEPVNDTVEASFKEESDYLASDYIVKPEIMSTFNDPIGVGITNSDFDVFGPENNSYNDVDVFNSKKNISVGNNTNNKKSATKEPTIPKKVDVKYFIALLIILVAIAIALLIIIFLPEAEVVNDSKPSPAVAPQTTANKVVYKNFIFEISDDYEFAIKNDALLVGDKNNKWAAQIEISNGSYEQLGSNISRLSDVFKENDFTSTKPDVRTEGGVEFITMEVKASEQNVLFALAEAGSTNYFGISLINTENNIDYYLLEKIAPIVKNAKDVSSSKIIANKNVFAKEFESLAK